MFQNEFTNQVTIIRKEYEQVENILTHRNNKLENLIDELQRKLDQYAIEIEKLRKELASRDTQPSESTIQLLWEKEKENKHLRELLAKLQQTPDTYEVRKIIDDKKGAIEKINEIISEIKTSQPSKPDLPDVENDCKLIASDLTKTNDKLNDVLKKLKDAKPAPRDKLNKDELVPKLEKLKNQCQDEINVLNRHLTNIDDKTSYFNDAVPETTKPYYPKNKDDKITIALPSDSLQKSPSKITVTFIPTDQPRELHKDMSPVLSTITSSGLIPKFEPERPRKHKHSPIEPCEACNDADYFTPQWKEPTRTEPGPVLEPLPSLTSDSRRKLIKEFYPPSPRAVSKEKGRKHKTKSGCCGKKESEFSNYPYERNPEESTFPQYHSHGNPNDEKLVKVHSPHNITENNKPYINPIKPNRDNNRGRGFVYNKPPKNY